MEWALSEMGLSLQGVIASYFILFTFALWCVKN